MAFTAAIRQCFVILTLVVTAAVFSGSVDARAATTKASEFVAMSDLDNLGTRTGTSEAHSKTPCKRPKVGVHHSCQICHQHLFIRPVSRTRSFLPAPKLKFVVIDTIADRLALASAQAATRLVLASDLILKSSFASTEVIARSARLRN